MKKLSGKLKPSDDLHGFHPQVGAEKHCTSSLQDRIFHAIRELADNPRPVGVKKLAGREAWRIRIGDYRVIYEIYDDRRIIIVVVAGHRREVYR